MATRLRGKLSKFFGTEHDDEPTNFDGLSTRLLEGAGFGLRPAQLRLFWGALAHPKEAAAFIEKCVKKGAEYVKECPHRVVNAVKNKKVRALVAKFLDKLSRTRGPTAVAVAAACFEAVALDEQEDDYDEDETTQLLLEHDPEAASSSSSESRETRDARGQLRKRTISAYEEI